MVILAYIVLFIISILGITKLVHTFLCLIDFNYDIITLLMGIVNWVIVSYVWELTIGSKMPLSAYITGFIGLILHGVLGGKGLHSIGAKQLGAEQGALLILIIYKTVKYFV
jgi:hypothetical protein